MDDNINSVKHFLNEFNENNIEENVKCRNSIIGSYYINPEDVKPEVFDWSLHYLEEKKCPYSLALILANLVSHQLSDSVYEMSLQAEQNIDKDKKFRYESSQLYLEMVECISELCKNWQDHVDIDNIKIEPQPYIISASAIKNCRRKMEDRHVIIHDLNSICGLKLNVNFFNIQDAPPHSYYAIFDGHAGVEAASYCAAHLHWNVVNHPEFFTNTEKAISEGFLLTDKNLLERSYREGIKGGCTALCCLIRNNVAYIAWVGDSQAVLVKQGTPVPIGLPHKPNREDEKCRIEEMGGCIFYLDSCWRVNGTLAVSRALGDAEHKPFISSEPEVLKIPLDGTEDYLILACDGLWDCLHPSDTNHIVYNHIIENSENADKVASQLVQVSKTQGSTDNITTIVVFLKDPLSISKPESIFPQMQKNGEENDCHINGSSPFDTLNSEEITKQTADVTSHETNISTTEQFKNELNSLNFPQNTLTFPHLLENTSTSLLQQYKHSCTSALLTNENPSVHDSYDSDISSTQAQSTPTILSNSMDNFTSQIVDPTNLNQQIVSEAEQTYENVLENTLGTLTNLNSTYNCIIKDSANVNPLMANITKVCGEQNIDGVLETMAQDPCTKLNDHGSAQSNDFALLDDNYKLLNKPVIQSTDLMQPFVNCTVNSSVSLLDTNNDETIQLTNTEDKLVENNSLNPQTLEVSCEKQILDLTSGYCMDILDDRSDLCYGKSEVAINNNFTAETQISSDSTNTQEMASELLMSENYFNAIDKNINNNNFQLETGCSHNNSTELLDFDKKESALPTMYNVNEKSAFAEDNVISLASDESEVIPKLPLQNCDNSTASTIELYNNPDDIKSKVKEEIETSTSNLDKNVSSLHSDIDSREGEIVPSVLKENYTSVANSELNLHNVCPKVDVCDGTDKKEYLLYAVDMPDCNKNEVIPQLKLQDGGVEIITGKLDFDKNAVISDPQLDTGIFSTESIRDAKETCLFQIAENNDILADHKITDTLNTQIVIEQNVVEEDKILLNGYENIHSELHTVQDTRHTEHYNNNEAVEKTQSRDLTKPKYDVENIPVFESPVNKVSEEVSILKTLQTSTTNKKATATREGISAKRSLLHTTKKLPTKLATSDKPTSAENRPEKKMTTVYNTASRRQTMQQPVKSSLKSMQVQQPKTKCNNTNKDAKQNTGQQTKDEQVKSSMPRNTKSTQLSVFERLSAPKIIPTAPKESRMNLPLARQSGRPTAKRVSEARAMNNMLPSAKALGAIPKKANANFHATETVKSKTQTPSTKLNTKSVPSQIAVTIPQRKDISYKANTKPPVQQLTVLNVKKMSSITTDENNKNKSKTPTTLQKPKLCDKNTAVANPSAKQTMPFRPATSLKSNTKQSQINGLQPNNSKNSSVRNVKAVIQRSSVSTKSKEGIKDYTKVTVGEKKESNATTKVTKQSNRFNMDGQGDCITVNEDNHLLEANKTDTELPNSDASKSKVPNSTINEYKSNA